MYYWFRRTGLICLMFVLILTLSACSNSKRESGQVLNLVDPTEPQTLDSAAAGELYSINILHNLNDGLYRFGPDEQPELALAASEPKQNGLTYTFELRDDIFWSDHTEANPRPITAHDFVYAIKGKVLDPGFNAPFVDMAYFIEGAQEYKEGKSKIVGIKAVDDKHLELRLKHPVPYLKSLLAFATFFPQREDVNQKFGEKYALDPESIVTTGSFVVSSWKRDSSIEFKKNPNYYAKDKVKLDKVEVKFVKDSGSQLNLYQTNKSDYMKLSFDLLSKFKGLPDLRTESDVVSVFMEFNHKDPFLKNENIRKAISLAVNKKELTSNIRQDSSIPIRGLVPSTIDAYEGNKFRKLFPDSESKFNPQEAKKLWHSGLHETGIEKPKIQLLISDDADSRKDAQFIQEQLRSNLDLKQDEISLVPMTNKVKLDKASKGDFKISLRPWSADYNDPLTFLNMFVTDSANNNGKWSNKTYDALVKQAVTTADFRDRAQKLHKAEQILIDHVGILPLYEKRRNVALNPRVKDLYIRSIAGDYDFTRAYIEPVK